MPTPNIYITYIYYICVCVCVCVCVCACVRACVFNLLIDAVKGRQDIIVETYCCEISNNTIQISISPAVITGLFQFRGLLPDPSPTGTETLSGFGVGFGFGLVFNG